MNPSAPDAQEPPSLYSGTGHPRSPEWRHRPKKGERRKRERMRWLMPALFLLLVIASALVALAVMSARGRPLRIPSVRPAAVSAPAAAPLAPAVASREDYSPETIKQLVESARSIRDLKLVVDQMQARSLYAEAAETVRRKLAEAPDSVEMKAILGQLYVRTGRYGDATRLLMEALTADPFNQGARLDLAVALWARGDNASALTVARWLIEAAPTMVDAHKTAARACLGAGWNDQAIEFLRQATDLKPYDMEARNMLALAYLRQGSHARAISHLQDIVKQGGADQVTYFNLAACYAQKRQPDDVVRVMLEASRDLGPATVAAWMDTEDFAPVSSAEVYKNVRGQMMNSVALAAREALRSPKTDAGLGILPSTDIRLRPIEFK